ncbi:hypothetical protein GCM10010399_44920 [Dactylosporangium fulvum]
MFARGELRLLLLTLLEERPRHGYDIIQVLRERFDGVYLPSPGTIYPRLRQLEADGMVGQRERGGRRVYQLTARGREELAARGDEVEQLRGRLDALAAGHQGADGQARTHIREVSSDLRRAADALGMTEPPAERPDFAFQPDWPAATEFDGPGGMIEAQLHVLTTKVRASLARHPVTAEQTGACAAILHETYLRLIKVLEP